MISSQPSGHPGDTPGKHDLGILTFPDIIRAKTLVLKVNLSKISHWHLVIGGIDYRPLGKLML